MSMPRCPAPQSLDGRSNARLTAPTSGQFQRESAPARPATNPRTNSATTARTGGGRRRSAVTMSTIAPCVVAPAHPARIGGEPPSARRVDNLYTERTPISVGEFACSRNFGATGPFGEESKRTPGPRRPPRQTTTTQRRRQWPL
jgi:hypothetical protein